MVELQEFFVEGGDRGRSHVLMHITEPSTREEQARGIFFALCEVNDGAAAQIEQLQFIIDTMENSYYSIPESGKDPFETCLEEANRRGHQLLRRYPDSDIHCLIGTIRDHHIAFAFHGRPTAALFYTAGTATQHINIIDSSDDAPAEQLFSSMLQGDMNPGDFFYGATPHVTQFLPTERVEKIILGRSARQSVQHMEKVLSGIRNGQSYGGFVVQAFTKDGPRVTVSSPAKQDTAASVSPLATDKANSARTTTAPTERTTGVTYETNYRPRRPGTPERLPSTVPAHMSHALILGLRSVGTMLAKIVAGLGHAVVGLILIISNKGGQREIVIDAFKRNLRNRQQALERMPLMSKVLIVLIILAGIAFVGSIGYLRMKEHREAVRAAYEADVAAIREKKNEADASLIYGDEAKATALVTEAKAAIANLPNDTDAEKDTVNALATDLKSIEQRLQKMVVIDPELIVDIATANTGAKTTAIAMIDNTIIAYGPDDQRHYLINLTSKQVQSKEHTGIARLTSDTTPKERDTIVFGSNYASIVALDKESFAIMNKDASFPTADVRITDVLVYNQKLYTLDTITGQIYKHNTTQTGYDKGVAWIKDAGGHDLTTAISFAIDGDIFVLKADGNVVKFSAGRVAPFSISGLIPAMTAPTRLVTTNNLTTIYIIEPIQKRLIAIDKTTGRVVKQYTSPLWQSPSDVIVDSDKNMAYVLDSNRLYKVQL